MSADQKKPQRRPGRPRKDPRGTQRELRKAAYVQRVVTEEGEKARRERARREVQRLVREVFAETPWFSKVVAWLFMRSAQRVVKASLVDIEPKELGEFVSEGFAAVLGECATFGGLSRAVQGNTVPGSMSSMIAAAATPDLGSFAAETLGDLEDDDVPALPPVSDDEAAKMGWLPEI